MTAQGHSHELSKFAIPDGLMRLETTDEDIPGGEPGLRKHSQRNRDRIVWSVAFRRMAYKTQVFPHDAPDHFRRRLTHTIEVSQLATSLTNILGLNSSACEAIALGHDIGHVAFGHAGEGALDREIESLGIKLLQRRFSSLAPPELKLVAQSLGFGFTHYEQGLRVLDYLEEEYYTKRGDVIPGLGLAKAVKDGILKHSRKDFPKKWHKPVYDKILRNHPFRPFLDRPTYLEGQAVAFADYLSYFVSDLEDGIRAKIIGFKDLEKFKIIESIKEWVAREAEKPGLINFGDDSQYKKFKRLIIKYVMVECLKASQEKLGSVDAAKQDHEYALKQTRNLILPCDLICNQMDEVYEECIRGKIHKHHLVVAANFKADKLIKELFVTFVKEPYLIPQDFVDANGQHAYDHLYKSVSTGECGIAVEELIGFLEGNKEAAIRMFMARDYISGMSDFFAGKKHAGLMLASQSLYELEA